MKRLPLPLAALILALALVIGGHPCLAANSAASNAANSTQPATLVGLTRADVIAALGKPTGERQRGDVLVMIYADGTKVELREGRVVTVSGPGGAQIIGADGSVYTAGADGRPLRVDAAPAQPTEPAAPTQVAPPAASEVVEEDVDDLPPGATAPPSVDAAKSAAAAALDESEADEGWEEGEGEEASPLVTIVGTLLGALMHFGLSVLVLRIALHVIGVPFFWPDLLKVALLYLAVYEVLNGLGRLGGLWEFLPIFRLHEVISFLVLACSLTWFKIAGSGITALKIAVATKLVLFGLMLAVGVVLALGLGMMMG